MVRIPILTKSLLSAKMTRILFRIILNKDTIIQLIPTRHSIEKLKKQLISHLSHWQSAAKKNVLEK
jgi:hypothetical protein